MTEPPAGSRTPPRPQQPSPPPTAQACRVPPLDVDLLSPLTLQFRDSAAESLYTQYRQKLWALADVQFNRTTIALVLLLVLTNSDNWPVYIWPASVVLGLLALHTALRHCFGPETFAAWRTLIMIPIRLSAQVATAQLLSALAPLKGLRWHLVLLVMSLFQGLRFVSGERACSAPGQ